MRRIVPLFAAALVACAAVEPQTLHPLPPAPLGPVVAAVAGPIAVSRVELPDYAERAGVATLTAGGALVQSTDDQWADSPARWAGRALAQALSQRTGAVALAEPWPPEFQPALRIDVALDEMAGAPGGPVRLRGEIRVAEAQGLRLALARRFDITAEGGGGGYAGLAAAHVAAIGALADELAAALAAAPDGR